MPTKFAKSMRRQEHVGITNVVIDILDTANGGKAVEVVNESEYLHSENKKCVEDKYFKCESCKCIWQNLCC